MCLSWKIIKIYLGIGVGVRMDILHRKSHFTTKATTLKVTGAVSVKPENPNIATRNSKDFIVE
jgi:hypothetical protein